MNLEKRPSSTTQTRLYKANERDAIRHLAQDVQAGKLIIMPTDTVYGIGCDAFNVDAIDELYEVKRRSGTKAIPILLAEVNQLPRIASTIPEQARNLISRFWPGPLTIILPKNRNLPANISPNENIAVRIPDHALTRSVIRMAGGAMAVTSANLSGEAAAINGDEAMRYFDGIVTAVLDDGDSPQKVASTIVDCSGDALKILRAGPISEEELLL